MDIAANKEMFVVYAKRFIKRPGIDKLLAWLETTDFYIAPASTRFHGAYEGGLAYHSILTYTALGTLNNAFCLNYPDETLAICGLMHDICKLNFYQPYYKNVKVYCPDGKNSDEGGTFRWEAARSYQVRDDDAYPAGHGEKSIFLLSKFMHLNTEETLAIRWHMGGYDDAARSYIGGRTQSNAFQTYRLAPALAIADMYATYFAD